MFTDDPISDFHEYDAECEDWLYSRPICDICDEHIQDDFYFEINGEKICECCMNENFRKVI